MGIFLAFHQHFLERGRTHFFLRKRNKKSKMASKVPWKTQWDQRMKRLNGVRNVLKIQLDQHKKRKDALDSLYGETPSEELRRGYCKSIFFVSVSCKLLSVSTHSAFISTLDN